MSTAHVESLIDLLQRRAADSPAALALGYLRDGRVLDQQITFAELEVRAQAIAAELQARNLAGQRAVLLYPSGIEFVCAFFGCLLSNVVAVPAPPPEASRKKRSGPRLKAIFDDCQAAIALSCRNLQPDIAAAMEDLHNPPTVLFTDDLANSSASNWVRPVLRPHDLAFVQYTSGSTSSPKGIEISHFNLAYHAAHLQKMCGYDQDSVTITWMPNFHDWGLIEGLIAPIFNGTPCYIMSPFSFVRRPKNWLDAITRYKGTHSQGPNFAYEHCVRRIRQDDLADLDLSSWLVADIAAEPIQFQVLQSFFDKFRPCGFEWNSFCPSFGLGEATLKVSHCPRTESAHALNLVPEFLERGQVVLATSDSENSDSPSPCPLPRSPGRGNESAPLSPLPQDRGKVNESAPLSPLPQGRGKGNESDSPCPLPRSPGRGNESAEPGPFPRSQGSENDSGFQKDSRSGFKTQQYKHEAQASGSFSDVHGPETHLLALRASIGTASKADAVSRTVVSCGRPFGATRIEIVEPELRLPLPEGVVGEIWVMDPAVGQGYCQRPEESAATFQARLADSGDGPFLRTGDLGFMLHGELYVSGRLKDLIIIRGNNHFPQDIEWTVQDVHPAMGGQSGAAFSVDVAGAERLVVLQEIDAKQIAHQELDLLLDKIVQQVVDEHEVDVYQVLLLPRGTIPKTASGKVQRGASRQAFLQNALEPIRVWRAVRAEQESNDSPMSQSPVSNAKLPTESQASSAVADEMIAWLRKYTSGRINSLLMDERRSVPPHILLDFGNRGLFGLQVPREFGGQGLTYADTLRVLEQLAAIDVSLATLVFLSNTNGLRPLLNYARPALQNSLVPHLAAGRHLAAFALSEPDAGSNVGAIATTATRQDDGRWLLSGVKRWNGSAWANSITVIARERERSGKSLGVSAFVVRTDDAGVTIGPESLTMGLRGIVQNSLHLDRVSVSADALLGKSGQGFEIVNDALSVGRLCTAAVCLGGMKRTAQILLGYVQQREIATGWLIEHPNTHYQLGQITFQIQAIESAANYLAAELDRGNVIPLWQTMAVKVAASHWFNECTATAMQLMGGRGYMENNEIPRLFRDARSLSIGEGPNESLIGFLGQTNNANAIVAWLAQSGQNELAIQLTHLIHELDSRCRELKDLPTSQQQQWSHFLMGSIAVDAFLMAIASCCRTDADHNALSAWCRDKLNQSIARSLERASKGPSALGLAAIQTIISSYQRQIGLICQQLPGEDQAMDPLVLKGLQAQKIPDSVEMQSKQNDGSTGSRSESELEKRRRLAQLLQAKIRD